MEEIKKVIEPEIVEEVEPIQEEVIETKPENTKFIQAFKSRCLKYGPKYIDAFKELNKKFPI